MREASASLWKRTIQLVFRAPYLEKARKLRIAVWHVRQVVYERRDDAAEREQRLIDVARLARPRVCRVRGEEDKRGLVSDAPL